MTCIKCGVELPEGSVYCFKCGRKQIAERAVKKRGNGQGTAVKRGKTWSAVWTEEIRYSDDEKKIKQIQRWKGGFPTETKALAYAANPPLKAEASKPRTLRHYYNGWVKGDYLDLSKSKKTAFDIAWKKLSAIADKPIASLTIENLQDVVDDNAGTFYPAKDIKTLLTHLYKRAAAQGDVSAILPAYIRLPKLEEKETSPFTEMEIKTLWEGYGNTQNHIIGTALLMIYTGLMPGELLNLSVDMIKWENSEIIGVGLKTNIRKKSPIVFPTFIEPVLRNLCESSGGYKIVTMGRNQYYDAFHAVLKELNIPDRAPYSCRHTTATALALGNIAPSVIQKVMRHAKFSTTQRYIHPDTASALEAVNSMAPNKI